MAKKKRKKRKENSGRYRDCIHVQSIGQEVLMTDPACPFAMMCLGTFTCMKKDCEHCNEWNPKAITKKKEEI